MIKTVASIAGLCGLLALVASPTLAQDKMAGKKDDKMAGKMADHKMSGKMSGHKMASHKKVTRHRKRHTSHKMSGKMASHKMSGKMAPKTGGDKMGKDKMKGGKM